ncbi:unnamed protein product [Absidia cylindrospora]
MANVLGRVGQKIRSWNLNLAHVAGSKWKYGIEQDILQWKMYLLRQFRIDHILNMVEYSTWDSRQLEAKYFDYWKPIFKMLFHDTLVIDLTIGNTACNAIKLERPVNECEHGDTTKS